MTFMAACAVGDAKIFARADVPTKNLSVGRCMFHWRHALTAGSAEPRAVTWQCQRTQKATRESTNSPSCAQLTSPAGAGKSARRGVARCRQVFCAHESCETWMFGTSEAKRTRMYLPFALNSTEGDCSRPATNMRKLPAEVFSHAKNTTVRPSRAVPSPGFFCVSTNNSPSYT